LRFRTWGKKRLARGGGVERRVLRLHEQITESMAVPAWGGGGGPKPHGGGGKATLPICPHLLEKKATWGLKLHERKAKRGLVYERNRCIALGLASFAIRNPSLTVQNFRPFRGRNETTQHSKYKNTPLGSRSYETKNRDKKGQGRFVERPLQLTFAEGRVVCPQRILKNASR